MPTTTRARDRRVLWINLGVIGAVLAAVLAIILIVQPGAGGGSNAESPGGGTDAAPLVSDDTHRLGEPADGTVELVEFADFECPGCAAFHPIIQQLMKEYEGRVDFFARYFPLPMHPNAEAAAIAAEAADRQDAFEAMYDLLFDRQEEWAGVDAAKADELFRGYAEELGLDLAQFDADVADPTTLERVNQDVDDGVALGLTGTPSFLLNGELVSPKSIEEFRQLLDAALGS